MTIAADGGHPGSFTVNVMQLNAWLIPVRPSFPGCLDFHAYRRARRMGVWLEQQIAEKRLDIAIFQEVWTPWRSAVACTIHSVFCCSLFGRHFVDNSLRKEMPFVTKIHGSSPCDCTKRFFDSGLLIASRYPIIEERFEMFPAGSPHDALSSKGALVAAVRRPEDGKIIIVCSSHLDAGEDNKVKLEQLRISIELIHNFTNFIRSKYSSVAATIFGSDMNIDGIEHWSTSNGYFAAKRLLESKGFKDAWTMTPRTMPTPQDIKRKNYVPDKYPQLGITSDQHDCVKRLDYIWVCPGSMKGPLTPPPRQQEMVSNDVSAKTELNDGILWRSSAAMREEVERAIKTGDMRLAKRLTEKIDLHDREMRLSDHAALFAQLDFI